MKEYLNDKFELVVTNQPDDGFILVPDGANRYTRAINGHETFWDNDNSILIHGGYADMSGRYTFGYYVEHYKAKILWQRENKVETAKGRFLHQWAYEAFGRGEDVQFDAIIGVDWTTLTTVACLSAFDNPNIKFRLKPETIQIGSRTIVKPISVKPEKNMAVFVSNPCSIEKYHSFGWVDTEHNRHVLNSNLCHLTESDAIAMTDAILELMK